DAPDDLIFDYLQLACYPDQAMGWPILGTEMTVARLGQDDLRRYMARHYNTGAMMLIASGAVDHDFLVQNAQRLFVDLPKGKAVAPKAAQFLPQEKREIGDLEQAHLAFAFPSVPFADPDAIATQVFATALGGGMSSRLFQEAREKRGLCYTISAFAHPYS